MAEKADRLRIHALPTKQLFIQMLTRDIGLLPAIADLADNCVDGARRTRGNLSLDGLTIRIEILPTGFRIVDNCGGIPVNIARDYAFRFGRDPEAPNVPHSIGHVGVGMKRAIFKLGSHFRVESTTETSRFVLDVDVEQWAQDPNWVFEMSKVEENKSFPANRVGTKIDVTHLHNDVRDAFALSVTAGRLSEDLREKLQEQIEKGLSVTVNGLPLAVQPLQLLGSAELEPAFRGLVFGENTSTPVRVRLYCGLSRDGRDRKESGWHVFCNGRLVLRGDKSELTGWKAREDDTTIAAFHGQYARLRGYAFFDCDDAGKLPWNTTKTSLDTESPVYRTTRPQMVLLMRPVLSFLNRVKEENERTGEGEKGALETLIERSEEKPLAQVQTRDSFSTPKTVPPSDAAERMQAIKYEVSLAVAERVREHLHVRTFKKVGERTFQYYYDAEVHE